MAGSRAEAGLRALRRETGLIQNLPREEKMREVVLADGYGYIGYLSIPRLELELPVMSAWDYERLRVSPCLQFGSVFTGDMVIAAHNYPEHFGLLGQLEPGAKLSFTDMDGCVYDYVLAEVKCLPADAVDDVEHSGHPLTLYTCTVGGQQRVAAFFDYADG